MSSWFLGFSVRLSLFLLFQVAVASGIMYPLSFTYYGELMNTLIMVPLEASSVARVISMFILFIAISAVLAFLERYCLSVFAGMLSLFLSLQSM